MKLAIALLAATIALDGAAFAEPLQAPDAASHAKGELRIAGSPDDAGLIARWEKGFRAVVPAVTVHETLHGPDSTMPALYTGVADVALLEREVLAPVEHMAFTWVYQYPEFTVTVAHAGPTTSRLGAAIAIFVNARNPIDGLTMVQLDGLYGVGKRGAAPSTWGDLGAPASWSTTPVHLYGPDLDSAWALAVRHLVLHDKYKWAAGYREISGSSSKVLDAVGEDPNGIAYGPLAAANPRVKPIAVAPEAGKPFVALSDRTLADGSYPLGRPIGIVINRRPGDPIEPKTLAFLRYVLSRQGQADIAADGAYVPLDAADADRQLKRLD